jgi:hypothetical protein
MANIVSKTFKTNSKDIKYVNRDFTSLKSELIDFTKKYYPQSYKDFSDSSPGTIFIEQAAYVGDVLSYYTDQQFKESFVQFATDRRNLINQARQLGYKPNATSVSSTYVDIFQLVPATRSKDVDGEYIPDDRFYLILTPYTTLAGNDGIPFIIEDSVDFNENTRFSPRELTVYSRDDTNAPQFYLAKKTVEAYSGQLVSKQFSLTTPESFLTLKLNESNVVKVISITDSNNVAYHETEYLAQDTIAIEVDNSPIDNQTLTKYRSTTPKLLKYLRTENRFTTFIDEDNYTYLQFGANTENFENTIVIPNPTNVGVGMSNVKNLNISLDGTNVMKSKSYGVSPSNTTLTVRYIIGGGLGSNVTSGNINKISAATFQNNDSEFLSDGEIQLLDKLKNSLRVTNEEASTGGGDAETNEQIRQNAISSFSTQNRMVTDEDMLLRVYSLPSKFGSIAKAYVESNSNREIAYEGFINGVVTNTSEELDLTPLQPLDRRKFLESTNPFTNNLYILTYDDNKNLTQVNEATLLNLKRYMSKYKILTDRINIIDGYIINIGVEFKISVFNGFNKKDVLTSCIDTVKSFFEIDNRSFNQQINLSQLNFEIMNNEGVQSVIDIKITNLTIDDGVYSPVAFNISIASQNNIVYPSKDPSIFEVKYPNTDIKGRVI